jgi:hypothetical protein
MEQESADPVAFSGQCKVVSEARTVVIAMCALKVNANVARKLALLAAISFLNRSCQILVKYLEPLTMRRA